MTQEPTVKYFDTGSGTGFVAVRYKGRRYIVNRDRVSVTYDRPGTFAYVSVTRHLNKTSKIAAKIRKIAETAIPTTMESK